MKDISSLKKNNVRKCMELIWKHGSVTKPQLAGMSDLSAVTTHKFINELVEFGAVIEANANDFKGKRASTYEINPKYCNFIGINLYDMIITASLFDFQMNCVHQQRAAFPSHYSETAFELICDIIAGLVKRAESPVIGIGVTLSGLMDFSRGIVTSCIDMPGWNRIPLKAKLEERFGIRVIVENDLNAGALVLKWRDSPARSSALVNIAGGVGVGVIINGEVFRGHNSYAGELGHLTVSVSGKLCRCGNRGCIEEFIVDTGILEESHLSSMDEVIAAARDGDPHVNEILLNRCEYIAILLDYVVKAYDPEAIYLTNMWLNSLPALFGRITDLVFSKSNWLSRDRLHIVLLDPTEAIYAVKGPAYAIFDDFIEHWGD